MMSVIDTLHCIVAEQINEREIGSFGKRFIADESAIAIATKRTRLLNGVNDRICQCAIQRQDEMRSIQVT
jgi:hypothetical protein